MVISVADITIVYYDPVNEVQLFKIKMQEFKMRTKAKYELMNSNSLVTFLEMSTKLDFINCRLVSLLEIREIVNIPQFGMFINETLSYDVDERTLGVKGHLSSSARDINILVDSKELGDILTIILFIVDTLNEIEHTSFLISTDKLFEFYQENFVADFNFENLAGTVFEEACSLIFSNLGFSLKINGKKFIEDKITMSFQPIQIAVKRSDWEGCGNILLKEYDMTITKNNSKDFLEMVFREISFSVEESELLFIFRMVGDLIRNIIEEGEKKDFELIKEGFEKVLPENESLVMNFYDCQGEILFEGWSLKLELELYEFLIGDFMRIPKANLFIKDYGNEITKEYIEIMGLEGFLMTFAEDNIDFQYSEVQITMNFVNQIEYVLYAVNYFIFMPAWLVYFMIDKHIKDKDGRVKYCCDMVRKSSLNMQFDRIVLLVTENMIKDPERPDILRTLAIDEEGSSVTSRAPFSSRQPFKQTKMMNKTLFKVEVSKFELSTQSFSEIKVDSLLGYFESINEELDVTMTLHETEIFFEDHKLLSLEQVKLHQSFEDLFHEFSLEPSVYRSTVLGKLSFTEPVVKTSVRQRVSNNILLSGLKITLEEVEIFNRIGTIPLDIVNQAKKLNLEKASLKDINEIEPVVETTISTLDFQDCCVFLISKRPEIEETYDTLRFSINRVFINTHHFGEENSIYLILNELVFGLDPNQKQGYAFLTLPLLECDLDLASDVYKINIPGNVRTTSQETKPKSSIYEFVNNTRSFTMFINYEYLSIFQNMFDTAWSSALIADIINKQKEKTRQEKSPKPAKLKSLNSTKSQPIKLIFAVFDVKILYMLDMQPKYEKYFEGREEVIDNGYFGYCIRQHSLGMKYSKDIFGNEDLKIAVNLLTFSFLNERNFDDSTFFNNDADLKYISNKNIKSIGNYRKFFEISNQGEFLILNKKQMDEANLAPEEVFFPNPTVEYTNIDFASDACILKVLDVVMEFEADQSEGAKDVNLRVNELKVLWNRLIKDIVDIIIFDDLLNIIDYLILKVSDSDSKEEEINLNSFNLNFELIDPQFTIQNESKAAVLLLSTRQKCQLVVQNVAMTQDAKNFEVAC